MSTVSHVLTVARKRIRRFDGQPRTYFCPKALAELAASIKEIGQREPIKVIPIEGDPDHDYVLDDGERRLKACELAQIDTMLAWVTDVKQGYEQFVDSVVSNFGREPHTPLESARAIKRILDDPAFPGRGLSQHKQYLMVSRMFARSYSWVHMTVRLLTALDPQVQDLIEPKSEEDQPLGLAMANYLASITDKGVQVEIAKRVAKEGLKLNQARHLARKLAKEHGVEIGAKTSPSDRYRLLESFINRLDDDAERVLDLKKSELKEALKTRSSNQLKALADKIDDRIKQLGQLSEVMRGMAAKAQ